MYIIELYSVFLISLLISTNLLYVSNFTTAINCKCIKFDETYQKEVAIFTSPNWPIAYKTNIDCLLYSFIAKPHQIVQITFDAFDVYQAIHQTNCSTGDFVRIYFNINPKIELTNEQLRSSKSLTICGKELLPWQQTLYSMDSVLLLQFHSEKSDRIPISKGFMGTFQFLNRSYFKSDGDHLPGTFCDYQFLSISSNHTISGKFFSPDYPNPYPENSYCSYYFMGKYNERVQIMFEKITFSNIDGSCLDTNDLITIHDGRYLSNKLIAQICNDDIFSEISSSGPDLYLVFKSGPNSQPSAQGFKAFYKFYKNDIFIDNDHIVPEFNASTKLKHKEDDRYSKDETTDNDKYAFCDQYHSSDITKNGTFHSPNYPQSYPSGIICKYRFQGTGKERVIIIFQYFNLTNYNNISSNRCEKMDSLMIFISNNGNKELLDTLCGYNLPLNIMSSGTSLIIQFRSLPNQPKASGFIANYRFVENFGINYGNQDTNLAVCAFVFNSSTFPDGIISSPNHPGLYPRDTECHYFFYGKINQQVHIKFLFFDIEGVPPCESDTFSDYLEFSHYPEIRSDFSRHCGVRKPQSLISRNNFLRIIFKSNDKFDGNGFKASFQFINRSDEKFIPLSSKVDFNKPYIHLKLTISSIYYLIIIKHILLN